MNGTYKPHVFDIFNEGWRGEDIFWYGPGTAYASDGHWAEVSAGVRPAPAAATVLQGAALPGLVNAHSHAFQRAFAGLAERRDG